MGSCREPTTRTTGSADDLQARCVCVWVRVCVWITQGTRDLGTRPERGIELSGTQKSLRTRGPALEKFQIERYMNVEIQFIKVIGKTRGVFHCTFHSERKNVRLCAQTSISGLHRDSRKANNCDFVANCMVAR